MVALKLTNYQAKAKVGQADAEKPARQCVAVFGDSKAIKDTLKEHGGRFSKGLTNPTNKFAKEAGWIFSSAKKDDLLNDKRLEGIVYVESDWAKQPKSQEKDKINGPVISQFLAVFNSYSIKDTLKSKYGGVYVKNLVNPASNSPEGAWLIPALHKDAIMAETGGTVYVEKKAETMKRKALVDDDSETSSSSSDDDDDAEGLVKKKLKAGE